MPLILALKNRDSVVVATDADAATAGPLEFGQFMNVPGSAILLMAGNIAAIKQPIMNTVLPRLSRATTAAALAQLVRAALTLEVVPQIAQLQGRVEIIVAGIDPVRHTKEPNLYYLDSAEDFYLRMIMQNYVAGGSTAAIAEILSGRDLEGTDTDGLNALAKDCLATTKMRWPGGLGTHQRLGIIAPDRTKILSY